LENIGPSRPTITVQNQTAAINVSLDGTQGVDIKGSGTLILGATNTYSGGTNIYGGVTLQVGDGGALPTAGTVTNSSALIFNSSGTLTLDGVISGSGTLTQNGSGTVILGGANYYSGPTVLNAGALRMAHANALGNATTDVSIPGGAGSARLELVNNISVARNIVLNGRGDWPDANLSPHLVNKSDNNTLTSNILLAESGYNYVIQSDADNTTLTSTILLAESGYTYLIQSDAGKLTLAGNIINNTGNATERELYLQGAGNGEFFGKIGNGTGSGLVNLLKDGVGTWTITQDVDLLGDITVIDGVLDMANINLATATVDVQNGAELIADSLIIGYLYIDSESKVTIQAMGITESLEE
jgi:fibronectin-binding autotransporter adhesin